MIAVLHRRQQRIGSLLIISGQHYGMCLKRATALPGRPAAGCKPLDFGCRQKDELADIAEMADIMNSILDDTEFQNGRLPDMQIECYLSVYN
jgi:hypothetical protein